MKVYVLDEYNSCKEVCVTEDIKVIQKSLCDKKYFRVDNSYPVLEIWEHGEKIEEVEGKEVLKRVAEEINRISGANEDTFECESVNEKIDWMKVIMNSLPKKPNDIWTDGSEILVKSEDAADNIADTIELLYLAQGEDICVCTGYFDPDEDKRNDEVNECTEFYYVRVD